MFGSISTYKNSIIDEHIMALTHEEKVKSPDLFIVKYRNLWFSDTILFFSTKKAVSKGVDLNRCRIHLMILAIF